MIAAFWLYPLAALEHTTRALTRIAQHLTKETP